MSYLHTYMNITLDTRNKKRKLKFELAFSEIFSILLDFA